MHVPRSVTFGRSRMALRGTFVHARPGDAPWVRQSCAMPIAMTLANVSAAFEAAGGERKRNWDKLDDRGKAAYVRRLRERGHEPEELLALLKNGAAAQN